MQLQVPHFPQHFSINKIPKSNSKPYAYTVHGNRHTTTGVARVGGYALSINTSRFCLTLYYFLSDWLFQTANGAQSPMWEELYNTRTALGVFFFFCATYSFSTGVDRQAHEDRQK